MMKRGRGRPGTRYKKVKDWFAARFNDHATPAMIAEGVGLSEAGVRNLIYVTSPDKFERDRKIGGRIAFILAEAEVDGLWSHIDGDDFEYLIDRYYDDKEFRFTDKPKMATLNEGVIL